MHNMYIIVCIDPITNTYYNTHNEIENYNINVIKNKSKLTTYRKNNIYYSTIIILIVSTIRNRIRIP